MARALTLYIALSTYFHLVWTKFAERKPKTLIKENSISTNGHVRPEP